MAVAISFSQGVELPKWAGFLMNMRDFGVDLEPNVGQEKWTVITVPTRSHISLLISLGLVKERLADESCHHRSYGMSAVSELLAGDPITWLDIENKFLNYGRVIDSNYRRGELIRYEFEAANKNSSITYRQKEMAVKFRFDRYFGEPAKAPRPLSEPSLGAETLYGLTNLDLQCRSANYVHIVGVLSQLELESQSKLYVAEYPTSLQSLLRPDHVFPTGHFLSRWTSVVEEDDSIIENSPVTIFDGASAFFRNRHVSSSVNIVIVDRWENRAFGVVEELANFAAMYGGLKKQSPEGLALEIGTFSRQK